jgi:hypothetical protein
VENKLNFTCQNRHYSKCARSCVCRGQQAQWRALFPAKEAKLKLTSWKMFNHSQYFIGFFLLFPRFRLSAIDESSDHWIECCLSNSEQSENNFTAFLCCHRMIELKENRKMHRMRFFYEEKLFFQEFNHLLRQLDWIWTKWSKVETIIKSS